MKVNQDKIDHLCALADAVERGETIDITDMSEEEFIAHLMDATDSIRVITPDNVTPEIIQIVMAGVPVDESDEDICLLGDEPELDPQPTLASLLEAFEAAREAYLELPVEGFGQGMMSTVREAYHVPADLDFEGFASHTHWEANEVAQAARRYIIARDFPNSKESDWEMIWKLKYGGL